MKHAASYIKTCLHGFDPTEKISLTLHAVNTDHYTHFGDFLICMMRYTLHASREWFTGGMLR
jgi:hypothetical protein